MYYNINDRAGWNRRNLIPPETYVELLKFYDKYIEAYIPISKVPNNEDFIFGYIGSAQFLIHKKLIQNLPREFYSNLYDWIITTYQIIYLEDF